MTGWNQNPLLRLELKRGSLNVSPLSPRVVTARQATSGIDNRLQNVSMTEVDTERLTVTGVESSARLSAVDRTR